MLLCLCNGLALGITGKQPVTADLYGTTSSYVSRSYDESSYCLPISSTSNWMLGLEPRTESRLRNFYVICYIDTIASF